MTSESEDWLEQAYESLLHSAAQHPKELDLLSRAMRERDQLRRKLAMQLDSLQTIMEENAKLRVKLFALTGKFYPDIDEDVGKPREGEV